MIENPDNTFGLFSGMRPRSCLIYIILIIVLFFLIKSKLNAQEIEDAPTLPPMITSCAEAETCQFVYFKRADSLWFIHFRDNTDPDQQYLIAKSTGDYLRVKTINDSTSTGFCYDVNTNDAIADDECFISSGDFIDDINQDDLTGYFLTNTDLKFKIESGNTCDLISNIYGLTCNISTDNEVLIFANYGSISNIDFADGIPFPHPLSDISPYNSWSDEYSHVCVFTIMPKPEFFDQSSIRYVYSNAPITLHFIDDFWRFRATDESEEGYNELLFRKNEYLEFHRDIYRDEHSRLLPDSDDILSESDLLFLAGRVNYCNHDLNAITDSGLQLIYDNGGYTEPIEQDGTELDNPYNLQDCEEPSWVNPIEPIICNSINQFKTIFGNFTSYFKRLFTPDFYIISDKSLILKNLVYEKTGFELSTITDFFDELKDPSFTTPDDIDFPLFGQTHTLPISLFRLPEGQLLDLFIIFVNVVCSITVVTASYNLVKYIFNSKDDKGSSIELLPIQ